MSAPDLSTLATALDQIGVVVPDLDAAEAGMRAAFGLEPRLRATNRYTDAWYRGSTIDTEVDALFYDLFGIEIEFLAPRGGPDIWQEFVDERGAGLHHIRFAVDDHDAVVDAMAAAGMPVHQQGDSVRGGGVRYAYFDARPSLGFFLEILSHRGERTDMLLGSHYARGVEIRWLEAFIVVAEELHFGRAAQRLHVAQSPLSQTIRRLEASMGAELFERNTRSVALTPAGRALLPHAYRVIQDLSLATEAARTASGAVHGTVRVGFSGAFNHLTLPALARAVRREMPEVDLQLVSRVRTGDGVAKLRQGTIDLAFVGLPLVTPGVASREIARTQLGAVVPIDHPLAGETAISARQLADDDFLSMPTDGSSAMAEGLIRCCVAAGFRPRITQEITDPYIMLTFVAAGLGVTITAEDLAPIMPEGARWVRLLDPPQYMRHGIAWIEDEQSAALRAVLELSERILPTPAD